MVWIDSMLLMQNKMATQIRKTCFTAENSSDL
jgi:hypothetical protein